jgi:hypothetical protein
MLQYIKYNQLITFSHLETGSPGLCKLAHQKIAYS